MVGILEGEGTAYIKQMEWLVDEIILIPATTLARLFWQKILSEFNSVCPSSTITLFPTDWGYLYGIRGGIKTSVSLKI